MKIIFFFSLLSNIAFFLWAFNRVPENIDKGIKDRPVKQILLMSELPKKTLAELNLKQTEAEKQPCYQLGPFANNEAIEVWARLNNINIESIKLITKDRQVVSRYLVYYPVADSFEQGQENVTMLKHKGVDDLWLYRKGELKGAVSLGLFAEENRALILQKKLQSKEIEADILQRYKIGTTLYAQLLSFDKAYRGSLTLYDGQLMSECEEI